MNVVILTAAILLLGSGKRKRRKSSTHDRSLLGLDPTIPSDPGPGSGSGLGVRLPTSKGKVWERCDPPPGSPKGVEAVFGKDGYCMVFWRPDTASVVKQTIEKMLMELPKSKREELCATAKCEDDPFMIESKAFCKWIPDTNRIEFIKRVTMTLWPQITASMLPPPPPDSLGRINCPYFVLYVWTRVMNIFGQEFCNFNVIV